MKKLGIVLWVALVVALFIALIVLVHPEYSAAMHGTADERVAFFTELLAIGTILLAAITSSQIFFLIRAENNAKISSDVARKSADAAMKSADAAVAAQRPWLKTNLSIAGDFTETNNVANISFNLTLQNSGNSPATKVKSSVGLYSSNFIQDMLTAEIDRMAPLNASSFGYTLFPEGTFQYPIDGSIPNVAFEEMKKSRKRESIHVILLTKYTFVGGEGETRRVYILGDSNGIGIFLKQLPIPSTRLILYPFNGLDSVS